MKENRPQPLGGRLQNNIAFYLILLNPWNYMTKKSNPHQHTHTCTESHSTLPHKNIVHPNTSQCIPLHIHNIPPTQNHSTSLHKSQYISIQGKVHPFSTNQCSPSSVLFSHFLNLLTKLDCSQQILNPKIYTHQPKSTLVSGSEFKGGDVPYTQHMVEVGAGNVRTHALLKKWIPISIRISAK